MIKYVIAMAGMVVLVAAQRSPYAGNPDRSYLQVLPQYRPAAEQSTAGASADVNKRFGEDDDSSSTEYNTPYDPYNDPKLLAQIATWPKEKQPFWYLNRNWNGQRKTVSPRVGTEINKVVPSVITRGSFAGQWQ